MCGLVQRSRDVGWRFQFVKDRRFHNHTLLDSVAAKLLTPYQSLVRKVRPVAHLNLESIMDAPQHSPAHSSLHMTLVKIHTIDSYPSCDRP